MLRLVKPGDSLPICEIYNHYIQHTPITFEESPLTPADMQARIQKVTEGLPWLVCEQDGNLIGYCYAAKWKERSAYRFSVEATIYMHPLWRGKGKGAEMFSALIAELRTRGVHSIIGGVALPNPASIALLERLGLRKIAHFSEVGYKFGKWIDVGYWQLVL
jgi:L-amino acid N-acyltransferase YncA